MMVMRAHKLTLAELDIVLVTTPKYANVWINAIWLVNATQSLASVPTPTHLMVRFVKILMSVQPLNNV
jgi:hypothetical protein